MQKKGTCADRRGGQAPELVSAATLRHLRGRAGRALSSGTPTHAGEAPADPLSGSTLLPTPSLPPPAPPPPPPLTLAIPLPCLKPPLPPRHPPQAVDAVRIYRYPPPAHTRPATGELPGCYESYPDCYESEHLPVHTQPTTGSKVDPTISPRHLSAPRPLPSCPDIYHRERKPRQPCSTPPVPSLSSRPITNARTSPILLPRFERQFRMPRCLLLTMPPPMAPGCLPMRWRSQTHASECFIAPRRTDSEPRILRRSPGRSPRDTIRSCRWTPMARTCPMNCRACSPDGGCRCRVAPPTWSLVLAGCPAGRSSTGRDAASGFRAAAARTPA